MAKAFDTVSHSSIANGLKRKGIPAQVISTILDLYTDSFTSVSVGGKTTRRIRINSGVKQGCPLSPLLFNLILDELIVKLKNLGIGIKMNKQLVSVMAFADDLVLITEHSSHMLVAIKGCQNFFNQKGLSVNVSKCGSLRVLPVKGKQSMKVLSCKHRWWGGITNPLVGL